MTLPLNPDALHELHTHLYGCLTLDDLYYLADRNQFRSDFFRDSYRRAYGQDPGLEGIFEANPDARKRLSEYYYFTEPREFQFFQACFDLVISLSSTGPEELAEICGRVVAREPGSYAEYRMMFNPMAPPEVYGEKVVSLAEAIARADRDHPEKNPRIALSISRQAEKGLEQYEILRELMARNEAVARYVVGLDFCFIEEGYPPSEKAELFGLIHKHNREAPERALSILYHVGESYQDKSLESAARWVLESARLGAHRLGHAVALGVPPEFYSGRTQGELVKERLAQLEFELEHEQGLRDFEYHVNRDQIAREKKELEAKSPDEFVIQVYDEERIIQARKFQDWAMEEIKQTGAVIESCPTSNLRIACLKEDRFHPLARFLEKKLPVVLGADDPGILKTDLKREFETVQNWTGISEESLRKMQVLASRSHSEILSGRASRKETLR